MASPYLLIGAFPALLRFLPKPGAWMETFKQFMGFVLVGTVVYLLAVLKPQYVVPTVGLLFSLSFLCWWVGRVTAERELGVKLRAWALGASVVALTWILMFPGLDENVLGRYHFRGLAAVMAPRPGRLHRLREAPSDRALPARRPCSWTFRQVGAKRVISMKLPSCERPRSLNRCGGWALWR